MEKCESCKCETEELFHAFNTVSKKNLSYCETCINDDSIFHDDSIFQIED